LFIDLTPFKHPEKSEIFLGTRFIPLSFLRRGGGEKRGASAPLRHPIKLVSFKGGRDFRKQLA
jgi:hypothetical protein